MHIYAVAADLEKYDSFAPKTYIGSAYLPWKECVDRVKDGISPDLAFKIELHANENV